MKDDLSDAERQVVMEAGELIGRILLKERGPEQWRALALVNDGFDPCSIADRQPPTNNGRRLMEFQTIGHKRIRSETNLMPSEPCPAFKESPDHEAMELTAPMASGIARHCWMSCTDRVNGPTIVLRIRTSQPDDANGRCGGSSHLPSHSGGSFRRTA